MSGSRRIFNVIIQLVKHHTDLSPNSSFSDALTLRFSPFSPDFWFFFCCVGFEPFSLHTNRQKLHLHCPSWGYAFDFDENMSSGRAAVGFTPKRIEFEGKGHSSPRMGGFERHLGPICGTAGGLVESLHSGEPVDGERRASESTVLGAQQVDREVRRRNRCSAREEHTDVRARR